MQDEPRADEILTRVANFLKGPATRESGPHISFQLRVAANAIEICQRQLTLAPKEEAERRLARPARSAGDRRPSICRR